MIGPDTLKISLVTQLMNHDNSPLPIKIPTSLVKTTMLRAPEAFGNSLPNASTGDSYFSRNGEYNFGSDTSTRFAKST